MFTHILLYSFYILLAECYNNIFLQTALQDTSGRKINNNNVDICYNRFHCSCLILGPGLFSLITEDGLGDEIFAQVSKRFAEIKHQLLSLTPSSSQDNETSDEEDSLPQLPPRKYKQYTLRSMFDCQKSSANVATESKPIPIDSSNKSHTKEDKSSSCYEEITFEDELPPTPVSKKSPSFFNSLIESSKINRDPTASFSSDSSSDGVYNVLSKDYHCRPSSETHYSQIGPHK